MSLLSSLARAYDRLPEAPPYRFSQERIGFCILLDRDGTAADVVDLRSADRKRSPKLLLVPQPPIRTSGKKACFLWDKSAYSLGLTNSESGVSESEYAFFVAEHMRWLEGAEDAGLQAFLGFLQDWQPNMFLERGWNEDMRDQNIVFALADEYRQGFIHERPAAKEIWRGLGAEAKRSEETCLVTGICGPIADLHPKIKGVWGAQTAGANLISYNADAFDSYGHKGGSNAPVSEAAAFAYGTVLNRYLQTDSGHRIQIGDTSTVFWADCSDMETAEEASSLFAQFFDPKDVSQDEKLATSVIRSRLDAIRQGHHLSQIAPELGQGVRFHVLGLAPNAARLSVRFYWQGDFGRLTEHYQRFLDDTKIDPPPRESWPPLWRYLTELAAQGKRENVPPLIAGEWLRAILAGTPYPLTLLATVLMRIRADGQINAHRAAILKSVLIRNLKKGVPVALDPANRNRGYILGRLFATYEEVQRAALGNVNASIRDKFYGSASATPQKVFRTLDAGSANHFGKLRKTSPGRAVNLEKLIGAITDLMEPSEDPIPASLGPAEQALFGIGYYHQRSDFFRKSDKAASAETPETTA